MFGAEFQNKVNPPTGAWIAFKAANFIDPALQTELYSDKPWLYSPLLCAMNIVNVKDSKMDLPVYLSPDNKDISCNSTEVKPFETLTTADQSKSRLLPSDILGEWIWKNDKELDENNASLFEGVDCDEVVGNDDIAERRRFFQKEKNRKKNVFKPGKLYHFEVSG